MSYTGLTWDHPRGVNALVAANAADPAVDIEWHTHPLEGFESADIAEIADEYDLIVLDHPHIGDALRAHSLRPFEEVLDTNALSEIKSNAIGRSYESYVYEGHTWALPLDAATQVGAGISKALPAAIDTWSDVISLAHREPVALSLGGPHAYLSFASVCVSVGPPPTVLPGDRHVEPDTALEALEILRAIARTAPEGTSELNPIGLLNRMSQQGDISYIPLVYGYVNYTDPNLPHPVTFLDAPAHTRNGRRGSTVGGTGIALSRRCEVTPELISHLQWLLRDETQTGLIPGHDGQPSARVAWADPELNRSSGGFYEHTLDTMTNAWVRPRFARATEFQGRASAILRSAILDQREIAPAIQELNDLYASYSSLADISRKESA